MSGQPYKFIKVYINNITFGQKKLQGESRAFHPFCNSIYISRKVFAKTRSTRNFNTEISLSEGKLDKKVHLIWKFWTLTFL